MLALAGTGGCSLPKASDWKPSKVFSLDSSWPWKDEEPKPEVPQRVVGMWTDTILHKPGETPQRGFGGRLIFYGENDKPVLVDGSLVVYAFDETGREPTDNKPTRRYVFPADQVALHHSESPVGPSYSFWLPWDEVGGPKTEISLICRFQPRSGPVVVSEQTRHLLPGTTPILGTASSPSPPKLPEGVPSRPANPQWTAAGMPSANPASGPQLASYEVPAAPGTQTIATSAAGSSPETPVRQMTTTTIPLPKDFEIPRGTPRDRTAGLNARMRSGTIPAQPSGLPASGQPTGVPGAWTPPPAAATSSAYTRPQSSFNSSPPFSPRPMAPPVYQPAHIQPPATTPGPQQLYPPVSGPFGPSANALPQGPLPPAQAMQQMEQLYQQQRQAGTASGSTAQVAPQGAHLPMQVPAIGTATVVYR